MKRMLNEEEIDLLVNLLKKLKLDGDEIQVKVTLKDKNGNEILGS